MKKLVLIRHGQSLWNAENKFTGWVDSPLSERGIQEAIKAGKLIKKFNVNGQIQLILDSQQALADKTNIKIINKIDKNLSLKSDKDSFTTIFSNLINNAIKYSKPSGLVEIKAIENKNAIIISISDNGVGIEKQYLEKVFNRFYRTPKARANSKGTGLGLALVKQLTVRMNAEVDIDSKIGKGTTVFVTFNTK